MHLHLRFFKNFFKETRSYRFALKCWFANELLAVSICTQLSDKHLSSVLIFPSSPSRSEVQPAARLSEADL